MNRLRPVLAILCGLLPCATATAQAPAAPTPHRQAAEHLAEAQDELAADVQQLILEQTEPTVIRLFKDVQGIMGEATDRLANADTGGATIAAQTEVLEKIHAAAKEKQQSNGKSGSAMMDMMERMMGKNPDGKADAKSQGQQPGTSGGSGQQGTSDIPNSPITGTSNEKSPERQIPKSSGSTSLHVPLEFRNAFDAYNKGLEPSSK